MDQAGVRFFLAGMFTGVLYVFGSLATLVLTARSYCQHRTPTVAFALLGILLIAVTIIVARRRETGSRLMFLLPGTFFLLGTGIPTWLSLHAARVCR